MYNNVNIMDVKADKNCKRLQGTFLTLLIH